MNKPIQYLFNAGLYGFLLWLLYDSFIRQWDPWFGFVVGFVIVLALFLNLVPALHAPKVSPGAYPYDD